MLLMEATIDILLFSFSLPLSALGILRPFLQYSTGREGGFYLLDYNLRC